MRKIRSTMVCCALAYTLSLWGQFAPAAGEDGSGAMHKDSSIFKAWASNCEVERGYLKISDTTFSYQGNKRASFGESSAASGQADGRVVSLGDGGIATLTFRSPISDKEGPDFAIFENGFQSQESTEQFFLELAFIEVSSDGEHFVRFPATSNTPESPQVGTFGQIDPTRIHNLAGKYEVFYGTPFDLEDLKDSTGIDLQTITHVKVIDAVGTVDENFASYDAQGKVINDPWPTPFASCGFDLDALGIIHPKDDISTTQAAPMESSFRVYPNPASEYIRIQAQHKARIEIYNSTGSAVMTLEHYETDQSIPLTHLPKGLYIIRLALQEESTSLRFIKK